MNISTVVAAARAPAAADGKFIGSCSSPPSLEPARTHESGGALTSNNNEFTSAAVNIPFLGISQFESRKVGVRQEPRVVVPTPSNDFYAMDLGSCCPLGLGNNITTATGGISIGNGPGILRGSNTTRELQAAEDGCLAYVELEQLVRQTPASSAPPHILPSSGRAGPMLSFEARPNALSSSFKPTQSISRLLPPQRDVEIEPSPKERHTGVTLLQRPNASGSLAAGSYCTQDPPLSACTAILDQAAGVSAESDNRLAPSGVSLLPRCATASSLGRPNCVEKASRPASSAASCPCGVRARRSPPPVVGSRSQGPGPVYTVPVGDCPTDPLKLLVSQTPGISDPQPPSSSLLKPAPNVIAGAQFMQFFPPHPVPRQRHVWSLREFPGGAAESDPLRMAYLLRPPGTFTLQVVGRPLWAAAAAPANSISGNCALMMGHSASTSGQCGSGSKPTAPDVARADGRNAWAVSNSSVELLNEPPIQVLVASGSVNQFRSGFPMQKTFILGRTFQELNNVPLEARRWFSRRHCAIKWTLERAGASTFSVCDLGSSNGTFVNGRQLPGSRKVYLKSGDIIGVSMTEEGQLLLGFRFSVDAYSSRIQGVGISGRLDEPRGWAISTWQPATWKEHIQSKQAAVKTEDTLTRELDPTTLLKPSKSLPSEPQDGSEEETKTFPPPPPPYQNNITIAVKLPLERICPLGGSCDESTGAALSGLKGLRSSLEVAQAS